MTRAAPVAALLVLLSGIPAAAQDSADTLDSRFRPLVTIGSPADERLRNAQLLGEEHPAELLIRAPSTINPRLGGKGLRWQVLAPRLDLTWNSDVPLSLNDGAMWAGRGVTVAATSGVRVAWGPLSVVAAPEVIHAQNRDTFVFPSGAADRSAFASPWHSGAYGSADLPLRFGNESLTTLLPGQSSVTLAARGLAVGAASENQWWGPALRNAIVLSNNAPGFPHGFLRSDGPWRTSIGDFEWRWIGGVLTESIYFDSIPANDHRAISAVAATFSPSFEEGLTVGVARSVIRPLDRWEDFLRHAPDAFVRWDATAAADSTADRNDGAGSDQILSVFARYLLPLDGLEVYGEWARLEVPASLRDLFTLPNQSRGYTVGMQYLGGSTDAPGLRVQVELTTLEKSAAARQRPAPTFYLGGSTEHGYTNRGQVLGAAIGPGASSQWVAIDHFVDPRWSVGVFGGRIRWENDTFYTRPLITRFDHDVSVFAGLRAAGRSALGDLRVEILAAERYNYLFQHRLSDPVRPREAVDVGSITIRVSLAPS